MKKTLLASILLSLLLPGIALAVTAVGWNTSNISNTYISPNKVNGVNQGVIANASSTIVGVFNVTGNINNGVGSNLWTTGPDANNSQAYRILSASMTYPALVIPTTGNIGIGSSSPDALLSISDNSGFASVGIHNVFVIASSTAGVATSTNLVFNSQGYLGLGTSSLTAAFAVQQSRAGTLGGADALFGDTATPSPIIVSHKGSTANGSLTVLGFNAYVNPAGNTIVYNNTAVGYFSSVDYRSAVSPSYQFNAISVSNTTTNIFTYVPSLNAFGLGTTTPRATFQVTNPASNATTSVQSGKPGQNKGTCRTDYDTAGSPVYTYWPAGATTPTYQNGGTAPSGCVN